MKNILIVLFVSSLISTNCLSQIKVSEIPKEVEIGKAVYFGKRIITCYKIESLNSYAFSYKNAKYKMLEEWESFAFKDTDNAFESLYNLIIQELDNGSNKDIDVQLPDDSIILQFSSKNGGGVTIRHNIDNSGVYGRSYELSRTQIQRLFGKRGKKKKR